MKPFRVVLLLFAVLLVLLVLTQKYKEGFVNRFCETHTDCVTCAQASGCSWCPQSQRCLDSTTLKSTDPKCNQSNTIHSAFLCKANLEDKIPPKAIVQDDIMYDFALYKNRITDKIPPPNLYMNGTIDISNADVVSNTNDVRNNIQNLHQELPGIIASSVENNIKPMVNGILSENYYIQGFQDMKSCSTHRDCQSCTKDNRCGWDPQFSTCIPRPVTTGGPMGPITQSTQCTLPSFPTSPQAQQQMTPS